MNSNYRAERSGRLVFVNPNGVNGNINGIPNTPPYENLCISVDLEVEVVHRVKSGNVGGNSLDFNSSTYYMTWSSYYNMDDGGNLIANDHNYVSFLQGEDARIYGEKKGSNTYLTTYYTDISLDDIKQRNIVEGLGISNVDISYDNMYMPTITIKFIDVRGSSLFGREEAVHNDNGITAETIFGCFFTLPYPKFKLHVKGFFGDAVTYQLACTGFKGNFNSETGNFEITATFIGYQFSLLTDIPFAYIMAAPYCEYVGMKYWEEHIKTKEWQLSDGKEMMKLFDIYQNLRKELREGNTKTAPNSKIDLSNKDVAFQQLWNMWLELKDAIKSRGTYLGYEQDGQGFHDTTNNKTYYLFLCESKIKIYDTSIANKYSNLSENISLFNNAFPENALSFEIAPNFQKENDAEVVQLFKYEKNADGTITREQTSATIKNEFKQWGAEKVRQNDDFLADKQWGCMFDDGGYEYSAEQVRQSINNDKIVASQKSADAVPEEISKAISFKPSIGNFFKIIIAHLETFTEMMYHCSGVIIKQMQDKKGREPSTLHVNINDTDVLSSVKAIPPFPAIYKSQMENTGNSKDSQFNALGWVGDFSANFEEEKLVIGLFNAIQRISEKTDMLTPQTIDVSRLFPSMPFDIYTSNGIFGGGSLTPDIVAATLGVRMTQIFGLLNDETFKDTTLAKLHGKMDALNLFQSVKKKDDLRKVLFKDGKEEGKYENIKDIIYNMMTCRYSEEALAFAKKDKWTNTPVYDFEHYAYCQPFAENDENGNPVTKTPKYFYDNNKRTCHPVVVELQNKKIGYTYIWGGEINNEYAIVPVTPKKASLIFGKEVEGRNAKSGEYYINLNNPVVIETDNKHKTTPNLLFNTSTNKFLKNTNNREDKKLYINDAMFNIITDKASIQAIKDRCEVLKKGDIKIDGYSGTNEDLKKIIDRYYDFDITPYLKSDEKEYLAKAKTDTLNKTGYPIDDTKINTTSQQFELSINNGKSEINSKLEFIDAKTAFETKDLNDYFVPYCLCKCTHTTDNGAYSIKEMSLDITTAFLNEYSAYAKETGNSTDDVILFKCWLLLHSLPLNWKNISKILKTGKHNGYVKRVPYAMVLLLGASLYFLKKTIKFLPEDKWGADQDTYFKNPKENRFMSFTFEQTLNNKNMPTLFKALVTHIHTFKIDENSVWTSFFTKDDDNNYKLTLRYTNDDNKFISRTTGVKIGELFGGKYYDGFPDYFISNKLEQVFLDWALTDGATIIKGMMNSSQKTSWGMYKTLVNEVDYTIKNGITKDFGLNTNMVTKFWSRKERNESNDSALNVPLQELKDGGNKYCNYFNTSWNYPAKKWNDEVWYGVYVDGEPLYTVENVVNMLNTRFFSNKWCGNNDAHWTAVCKNEDEFIAYWKSNAEFMTELVDLYTRDCLVCLNVNESTLTTLKDRDLI